MEEEPEGEAGEEVEAEDEVGEDLAVLFAEAIVDKYPGFQLATACDSDSDYDSGLESDCDEDLFY